jgi:RNA polymerase sigma-70 factor (ECF subfamily)
MDQKPIEKDSTESDNTSENGTKNDTNSILRIFKLHEKSLRHYISGFFIRPQDIEDISQETFLRTFKSHMKKEVLKPKSFMYRVAKNLIMSEFRRSSYKLTDYIEDINPGSMPININNLEDNIEAQEKLGMFCEALATLPEKCRRIMVMRKVYGFTIKEIASRMDMPVSTINWNLAKGITHCDNIAEEYEQNKHQVPKENMKQIKVQSTQTYSSHSDDGRLDK